MAEQYFNSNACKAVAQNFLEGSQELGYDQDDGVTYHISGDIVTVREQSRSRDFSATPPVDTLMMRCAAEDGGEIRVYNFPLIGFVNGVAFALAVNEKISPDTVNVPNLTGVCYELGKMIAARESREEQV